MDGKPLPDGTLVNPSGQRLCWRSRETTPKHYACTRLAGHTGLCALVYTPGFWRRVADVFVESGGTFLGGGSVR